MGHVLGLDAKTYRNTGTFAVPVFTEVDNIRDLSVSLSKGQADVSARSGGGWLQSAGTLKELEVTFNMVYDTGDTQTEAVQDAFFNDTIEEWFFLDGNPSVAGAEGIRAYMEVFDFGQDQNLTEAMMYNVVLRPTRYIDAGTQRNPSWYEST